MPTSLRRLCRLAIAGCLAFCAWLPAVADESQSADAKPAGLLQTLPADGAWVSYDVTVTVNEQDFTMTATARSVGQALHDGQQCRFIEYEQSVEAPPAISVPQLGNLTWRLLVPEEEFGEGRDPLGKAVKTWIKIDDRDPEAVESIELKDPIYKILFQGPRKNLRNEDAKEKINWQRGQLECAVVTGHNDLELGIAKLHMTHRVLRHRDIPFGIAALQQELTGSLFGQEPKITIRVTLRDHGKDAKAKLPELQP